MCYLRKVDYPSKVQFTRILQYLEACFVIEMWSIVINISTQRKGG
jgi:hypothetical protein